MPVGGLDGFGKDVGTEKDLSQIIRIVNFFLKELIAFHELQMHSGYTSSSSFIQCGRDFYHDGTEAKQELHGFTAIPTRIQNQLHALGALEVPLQKVPRRCARGIISCWNYAKI